MILYKICSYKLPTKLIPARTSHLIPPPLYNRYESRGDLVFIYQTNGNF